MMSLSCHGKTHLDFNSIAKLSFFVLFCKLFDIFLLLCLSFSSFFPNFVKENATITAYDAQFFYRIQDLVGPERGGGALFPLRRRQDTLHAHPSRDGRRPLMARLQHAQGSRQQVPIHIYYSAGRSNRASRMGEGGAPLPSR